MHPQLDTALKKDSTAQGLPTEDGTRSQVSADGQQVWCPRTTVSGWVLVVAMVACDGNFLQWLSAAPEVSVAGPLDDPKLWGKVFADTSPDWHSL